MIVGKGRGRAWINLISKNQQVQQHPLRCVCACVHDRYMMRSIGQSLEVAYYLRIMITRLPLTHALLLLACILGAAAALPHPYSFTTTTKLIDRSSFPPGFVFGAGSSAYQYEGASNIDGKKPSIWDTFTHLHPEKITDHSTGDVADDFYNLFQKDIALMTQIGLDSYRFSLSWPRILPGGKISRGVNWDGVNFYNHVIDHLLLNGIKPLVTLFHWDVPQALEDEYRGILSPSIVYDFRDYADFCFKVFGDRVKYWVTINEPNLFSMFGYATGTYAPGRCSDYIGNCTAGDSATEPYIVVHHLILSHAIVANLYRNNYQDSQKGIIGISIFSLWWVPKYQTVASRTAASRALDFMLGWILHPITYGEYPETMRYLVGKRLPEFTTSQSEMVKGSVDFVGINYYTACYADDVISYSTVNLSYTTDSRVNSTYEKDGIPIGEPTACNWIYIYPKGIRELLLYVKKNYNHPTIYITENGMANANNRSLPLENVLNDTLRIKYYHHHLSYLLKAIKEGVDVKGYYMWAFLDNFEWVDGYTLGFGINYVDYGDDGLRRYMKLSASWFQHFLLHPPPHNLTSPTSPPSSLLFSH